MVEALVELATMKRSPWLQEHDWSNDARSLRELAIRTPWIVTDEFVWSHFKSLYLVDKCVSDSCQLSINSVRCPFSDTLKETFSFYRLLFNLS